MKLSAAFCCGVVTLTCLAAGVRAAPPPKTITAAGAVEVPDAAGDMKPFTTSGGTAPALDVVKLSLKSDGAALTFGVTLNDLPGGFASDVVVAYLDTDDNATTGAKIGSPGLAGLEYKAALTLCVEYEDGGRSCGGGRNAKVKARYAAVDLERYTGQGSDTESGQDAMGFPGRKPAPRVPVTDQVLQATVSYDDLHVKPGQKVRVYVKESGGNPVDDGFFPPIVLTLK